MRQVLAVLLLCLGLWCLGQARSQVNLPLLGVGATVSGAAFTGLGDCSGCPSSANTLFYVGLRAYSAATAGTKSANICNASDVHCADVNTLANGDFDVATVTAAPFSCGGAGGTCTIKTLYDKSGALDCTSAVCDVTQTTGTAANRPTLAFNCVGTRPCLACSAANSPNLGTLTVSATHMPPFTVAWAGTRTIATPVEGVTSNAIFAGYDAAGQAGIFSGNFATAAAADGTFFAIGGLFSGTTTTSAVSVNGSATGGQNAGTGNMGSSTGYRICNFTGGNFLDGNVFEIAYWNGDQSGAFAALSTNQRAYWGF